VYRAEGEQHGVGPLGMGDWASLYGVTARAGLFSGGAGKRTGERRQGMGLWNVPGDARVMLVFCRNGVFGAP
jgi:hypothetical protein